MADRETRSARIGLIRVAGGPDQTIEEAQQEMLGLCEQCLEHGADLVLTPEAYQYRTARKTLPIQELVKWAPAFKDKCSDLARRYHAYVAPWDYELNDQDGKYYNAAYILDRDGREIGRYRKTHQTRSEEQRGLSVGMEYPVFDLDFGKVGIMICFDNYFPEVASLLALHGAELILYTLYGDTMMAQWETKLRARAIDHCVWIASVNVDHADCTRLVDPRGEIVANLTQRGSWAVHDIELSEPVISCTAAVPGQYENLRQYLVRKRNPQSYGGLQAAGEVWPWERIMVDADPGKILRNV